MIEKDLTIVRWDDKQLYSCGIPHCVLYLSLVITISIECYLLLLLWPTCQNHLTFSLKSASDHRPSPFTAPQQFRHLSATVPALPAPLSPSPSPPPAWLSIPSSRSPHHSTLGSRSPRALPPGRRDINHSRPLRSDGPRLDAPLYCLTSLLRHFDVIMWLAARRGRRPLLNYGVNRYCKERGTRVVAYGSFGRSCGPRIHRI